MLYLSNAFSLGMLSSQECTLKIRSETPSVIRLRLKSEPFTSSVGHESTARLMSKLLDLYIPVHRTSIKLREGDELIVFQLKLRLPEGKTLSEPELNELVEKGLFSWRSVKVLGEQS